MLRFSGEGALPAVIKVEASPKILRGKEALEDDGTWKDQFRSGLNSEFRCES
jgi:hypothetical protein